MGETAKIKINKSVFVVQSLSWVWFFAISWTAAHKASLSFTISQSLLKFLAIGSMMLSNHLILCHPLHMLLLIFPSTRVFFSESAVCIWLQFWGWFILGLIGLNSVQCKGFSRVFFSTTIGKKKALIVWHSVFFMAQLSQLYMTTGKKTLSLTIQTFVDKKISLFFNMLSRFAISWPQRSCKTKLTVVRR